MAELKLTDVIDKLDECDGGYSCPAEVHYEGCLVDSWDGVCQYGEDCPACEDDEGDD